VVGVAAADPLGVQRYVRGLSELAEAVPGNAPVTVANRVRRGPTGSGDPREAVRNALARYAGVEVTHFIPYDRSGFDTALAAGRTLTEVAPRAAARLAIRDLAADLVSRFAGGAAPAGRRRSLLGRR
jgi:Flp pilus assembly CpaE family ATPase